MGGGAAVRAAAKVAGIGVATGLRGGSTADFPANLVSRRPVRPALPGVLSCSSEPAGGPAVEPVVQPAAREIDDWDFAGDELIGDRTAPGRPRMVFGPAPSLQEAQDATSELKDAIDKIYLSSPQSSGSVGTFSSLRETKACITHESSVPRGAVEAFMMLKERPAVQSVVASIVCDPNVWNAMMENPALVEFLESEKSCAEVETPKSSVGFPDAQEETVKSDGFRGFIKDIKHTMQDMVNSLSNFAHSFFSEPAEEKKSESSDGTFRNFITGGSLMALVMMVITVVVLRRVET